MTPAEPTEAPPKRRKRLQPGTGHVWVRPGITDADPDTTQHQSAFSPVQPAHAHDWMWVSGGWKWCGGCGALRDPDGYILLPEERLK